jgi:hypothetical protein
MPGIISVQGACDVGGAVVPADGAGRDAGRAISGNAAKSALPAIPLASDRLLIVVLASFCQDICRNSPNLRLKVACWYFGFVIADRMLLGDGMSMGADRPIILMVDSCPKRAWWLLP